MYTDIVQCTLYSVPFTLYSVPFTLYSVPFKLYCVPFTLYCVPFTLYTVPCTLYTVHYTLYIHFCPCQQHHMVSMHELSVKDLNYLNTNSILSFRLLASYNTTNLSFTASSTARVNLYKTCRTAVQGSVSYNFRLLQKKHFNFPKEQKLMNNSFHLK